MKTTTKTILLLLVISFILPYFPVHAAGTAVFKLTSVKTDYYVGDTVYVDIMVEPNGASLNTVRAIMNFTGSSVLSISDFSIGTAWPYPSPGRLLDNVNQLINVGGFILVDSVTQNSKFGTLIFNANQVGSSTITFAAGSHLIDINQIEQINLSGCQGITINVLGAPPPPNNAPVFVPVADKSVDLGQPVNFNVSAADPDNDNVALTWDIPSDAVFSNVISGQTASGDLAWIPTAKGSYSLKFYATDDSPKGAKTSSLTILVNVSVPPVPVNHAPVFQPVGNKQLNIGESVNFHVQATDPDNDKINLIWNIPAGAIFNNVINDAKAVSGDFSWTPSSQGIYTVIFTATDDSALGSKSFNLTVSIGVSVPLPPPNHPSIFEPVAEKTVNAGELLTFNVSATDPDGDTVILSLEPLETATLSPITSGVTATSRFSWIPQNFGIYYAVFKATDNNLNPTVGLLTVRITVFGGACPPCSGGGGGSCPICQCEKITENLPTGDTPVTRATPIITSPSHPSQDLWYSNNTPQFVWQTFDRAESYIFNLDQNPLTELDYGYLSSQDTMFSFNGIGDGFWYFHLRAKYADGFTPVVHYQIKIDTTPPEFFKPSIEGNDLFFSALDTSSGVAYYEMKIDAGNWQTVFSPFDLDAVTNQGVRLTLRAVDNAGNAIESYIDLKKKEVLVTEEQKKYIVEDFLKLVAPPLIESVSFEQNLVITGKAAPNSLITLYLSTEPVTIFSAQADEKGQWLVKFKKGLSAQKYVIYATATLDGQVSVPSEKAYFTIVEKFTQGKTFYMSFWMWIPIIILLGLVIYLWRKDKILGKTLGNLKKLYVKNKKQNNNKR